MLNLVDKLTKKKKKIEGVGGRFMKLALYFVKDNH